MRRSFVAIVSCIAAVLAWLWLAGRPERSDVPAPPEVQQAAPLPAGVALDPLAGGPGASARAAEPAAALAPPATVAGAAPADEAIELRGTIVAIDENGAEHAHEDGAFELVAWKGYKGKEHAVVVRGGEWTARVARGVELGAQAIELGDRSALLEGETLERPLRLALPADGQVVLRARWLRGARLFVRDRDTNLDLADVTLVRALGWPRSGFAHPGDIAPWRVLVAGGRSPVELPPGKQRLLELHACSPGHAWERGQLDGNEGGERVIVLGPGGDLEVRLAAERIDARTVLRVRNELRLVVAEVDIGERRALVLEGLPVGTAHVSAEIGDWWENPIVLARAETGIRAETRASVELALGAPPDAETVAFGGEVVLAPEWGLERFLLVADLLDPPLGKHDSIRRLQSRDMRKDEARPGVWHWRLEGMQSGRYQLQVWQLQYAIGVDVPRGGRDDLRIEPPLPCEARVRVVDRLAGTEAEVEHVHWNFRRPEGVHGGGAQPALWDAATRVWSLRAPVGEIELHTTGTRYRPHREIVALRAGVNEVVLELERQYSLRLVLAQAGKTLPWPTLVELKRQPAAGGEVHSTWGGGGLALLLVFEHPGDWIVTLPEIPGYAAVPAITVRVDPERETEHTIELAPR